MPKIICKNCGSELSKDESYCNTCIEERRLQTENKSYSIGREDGYNVGYEMGLESGIREGYESGMKEIITNISQKISFIFCIIFGMIWILATIIAISHYPSMSLLDYVMILFDIPLSLSILYLDKPNITSKKRGISS